MAADITTSVKADLLGDGTLIDLSDRVQDVSGSYGAASGGLSVETGSARIVLDGRSNFIVPGGSGGTYEAEEAHGNRVEIASSHGGVERSLFVGFIWDILWGGEGNQATVTLVVVDAFSRLADSQIVADLPAELSGARVNRILSLAGYPDEVGARSVDDGTIHFPATSVDGNALDLLATCALSEAGQIFIDHAGSFYGALHFVERGQLPDTAAVFSDTPAAGELTASRVPTIEQEAHLLFNRVAFTLPSGEEVVAVDDVSSAKYGDHSLSASVFCGYQDAVDLAEYLVEIYSRPLFRVAEISNDTHFEDDAAAAKALALGVGSVVEVGFTPPSSTSEIQSKNIIDRVAFRSSPLEDDNARLSFSFRLRSSSSSAYWLVADPLSGVLGRTTTLAPPLPGSFGRSRNQPGGRVVWSDADLVSAREFGSGLAATAVTTYPDDSTRRAGEVAPSAGQMAVVGAAALSSGTPRAELAVFGGTRWVPAFRLGAPITHTPDPVVLSGLPVGTQPAWNFGDPPREYPFSVDPDVADVVAASANGVLTTLVRGSGTQRTLRVVVPATDTLGIYEDTITITASETGYLDSTHTIDFTINEPPPEPIVFSDIDTSTPLRFGEASGYLFSVRPVADVYVSSVSDSLGVPSLTTSGGGAPGQFLLTITPPATDGGVYSGQVVLRATADGSLDTDLTLNFTITPFGTIAVVGLPATTAPFEFGDGARDYSFTVTPADTTISLSSTNSLFAERIVGSSTNRVLRLVPPATDGGEYADTLTLVFSADYHHDNTLTVPLTINPTPIPIVVNGLPNGAQPAFDYGDPARLYDLSVMPASAVLEVISIGTIFNVSIIGTGSSRQLRVIPPTAGTEAQTGIVRVTGSGEGFVGFTHDITYSVNEFVPPPVVFGEVSPSRVRVVEGGEPVLVTFDVSPATTTVTYLHTVIAGVRLEGVDETGTTRSVRVIPPALGDYQGTTTSSAFELIGVADGHTEATTTVPFFLAGVAPTPITFTGLPSGTQPAFEYGDDARTFDFTTDPTNATLRVESVNRVFTTTLADNSGVRTLSVEPPDSGTETQTDTVRISANRVGFLDTTADIEFSVNEPPPPEPPPAPVRPALSLSYTTTSSPLTFSWVFADHTWTAIQLRRVNFRPENEQPVPDDVVDNPLAEAGRYRYRDSANTRWNQKVISAAATIAHTSNVITAGGSWAVARAIAPARFAVRLRLADGTWTLWSNEVEADPENPQDSPVATLSVAPAEPSSTDTLRLTFGVTDTDTDQAGLSYWCWLHNPAGQAYYLQPASGTFGFYSNNPGAQAYTLIENGVSVPANNWFATRGLRAGDTVRIYAQIQTSDPRGGSGGISIPAFVEFVIQ